MPAYRTARFRAISRGKRASSFDEASAELGSPVFIKPANMGSSVGVSRASTRAEYEAAVETALQYDSKVLVEERILGREIECSVLGNADPIASVPGEIETGAGHAFYDYRAKYIDENGAVLLIPAPLEASVSEAVRASRFKPSSPCAAREWRESTCSSAARRSWW